MRWVHPLDVVMAPIHGLERARGWRRVGLLVAYGLVAAVVGVFVSRWVNLWAIPDAPEPFDAARFEREQFSGASSLGAAYLEVATHLRKQTPDSDRSLTNGLYVTDWTQMDVPDQAWFHQNRAMLEPWLAATSRPLTPLPLPSLTPIIGERDPADAARFPARIALIEGYKREAAGDLDGAWTCYRSTLRGSRQVAKAGSQVRRQTGYHLLKMAQPRVQVWTAHPQLTAPAARRALADLTECIAASPRPSETIKAEALFLIDQLRHPETWSASPRDRNDPAWYEQHERLIRARWFVRGEPERSRRLLRLLVAQALAQCDRDPAVQPPLLTVRSGIWQADSQTPPLVRQFTPERLEREISDSVLPGMVWATTPTFATVEIRDILEPLQLALAERVYLLERGKPAEKARDLLDGYLDTLPRNMDPDELLSSPIP